MNNQKNQIVHIDFHGGQIEAVQRGEDIWVSVRRACEHLGIASNGQIEKLKDKEWATDKIILSVDPNGRNRKHFMLHIDSFPMWLATIDTGRVAKSVRPLLVAYQKEAAKVLRDHFFGARENATESPYEKERRLAAKEERLSRQQKARGWERARKIAEQQNRMDLVELYNAKIAEVLTGEPMSPPPQPEDRWESFQKAILPGCPDFLRAIWEAKAELENKTGRKY